MGDVTIVVSDLHIGAGPLDDCDEELEEALISFLEEGCANDSPVELVINGDFLDFPQASPWKGAELESQSPLGVPLCFTQEQSEAKLEAIIEAHRPVFTSLGNFLAANPDNNLVIIPGNHDADFFWKNVRTIFAEEVCKGHKATRERLRFHLQQVYQPPQLPPVWIEHGNQYDPINSFYVDEYDATVGAHVGKKLCWSESTPPIFEDTEGQMRLYECIGTRFLIKFLNQLDADYPFVDNVKPFSRFVNVFGLSALAGGRSSLKATLSVWGMLRYLAGTTIRKPGDLLGLQVHEGDRVSTLLSNALGRASAAERSAFVECLRRSGMDVDRPVAMYLSDPMHAERFLTFLAGNLECLDTLAVARHDANYLSTAGESGYLSLAKGFNVDETKELTTAAEKILREQNAAAVVMGHTHEPVSGQSGLAYLNPGSWTRYYNFSEEKLQPWSILQQDSYKLFPYELNYVEIDPRGEPLAQMKNHRQKKA